MIQPALQGQTIRLRPLLAVDFDPLYQAASDPLIWAQHPSSLRYQYHVFVAWFKDAIASKGALIVIDEKSNEIIGTSRFYDRDIEKNEVAIGFTFLTRAYWGGCTNAELKKLMLDHAFQVVDRVWFHVDPSNIRSQKAMEKIGAIYSHKGSKVLTGGAHEYVFYKIDKDQNKSVQTRHG